MTYNLTLLLYMPTVHFPALLVTSPVYGNFGVC